MKRLLYLQSLVCLLGVVISTGCATSAPQAIFIQPPSASSIIRPNDEVTIVVQPAPDVSMVNYEKERLTQRIQEKLDAEKILNPAGNKKNCEVDVTVTKYDKGDAFARAMLAGLGAIHINAKVQVYLQPSREKIGDFIVNKTFAWGGVYGASTTIEDAEMGFAEGVANALTGQIGTPPPKPKSKD